MPIAGQDAVDQTPSGEQSRSVTTRRQKLQKLVSFGFSMTAMLVPAALQFVLFAFYARVLGVEQYGIYIALLSWNPICFELVGIGAGEYLIKRSAQDESAFGIARGHMLAAILYTLPVAMALFTFLAYAAVDYRIGLTTILLLCLSEFLGYRLLVCAEQAAISLRRFGMANWFRVAQGVPRLLGVVFAYFVLGLKDVSSLALAGSFAILLGGIGAEIVVRSRLPATKKLEIIPEGLRNGTWFMGNQLVRAGQQNIDRVVLSAVVDPATLALYGAAQRFIQVGILPIQTVLRYTYPHFFKEGKKGIGSALRYGIKVLPLVAGVAAVTAAGLMAAAGFLPLVVGQQYAQSVTYLFYLAPVLVLFAVNYVATDTLSGGGYLSVRTLLTASGVGVQAALFLLFHDGKEIVLASYGGMGITCIVTWLAVFLLARRSKQQG